jgi:hypothetical protein
VSEDVPPYRVNRTPEQQRDDEERATERAQKAHQPYQDAIFAVMHQMIPHGNGVLTQASLDELDAARKYNSGDPQMLLKGRDRSPMCRDARS